ncbi:MAG: DUF1446 domain-containing protein [Acidimicrobiia bacterium]|nr:DUF1446 domain-containing protein [Acidimicrobiia bacterium]
MSDATAITIVTPTGCIGNRGIDRATFAAVVAEAKPDAIAVDAGSIDCGPWYLGAGREHSPLSHIEWDIETILAEAVPRRIPVIIGSAGGSGARAHVDRTLDVIRRIAHTHRHQFRLAAIYSDVPPAFLLGRAKGGVIEGAERVPDGAPLSVEAVKTSDVIVGLMGVGPMIDALRAGADVIVAGRAVDAAVIAAFPASRGIDLGLAYHMGDIMECAETCAEEITPTLRAMGRNRIPIVGRITNESFELKPGLASMACTPESCLMHSAYERTSLDRIKVPEGTVDRSTARYERVDANTTRISGTRFVAEPHSILFEGVRRIGFRSIFPFAIRTPRMIAAIDGILADVDRIEQAVFGPMGRFRIHWHHYGRNAVLRDAEPEGAGHEIGLFADVVADNQALAHDVAYDLFTRIGFWRYPGRTTTAGNVAVTLSPAVFDAGAVYEFSMYHAMPVADSRAIFKTEMFES